jgi:hypothetical protein
MPHPAHFMLIVHVRARYWWIDKDLVESPVWLPSGLSEIQQIQQ